MSPTTSMALPRYWIALSDQSFCAYWKRQNPAGNGCSRIGKNKLRGLFVGFLVFLQVVSVLQGGGGRSSRVEGGMRGWSSQRRLGSEGWKGGEGASHQPRLLPSTPVSSLMMRPRLGSTSNPLWRRKPSSTTMLERPRVTPARSALLQGRLCSGVGTAH